MKQSKLILLQLSVLLFMSLAFSVACGPPPHPDTPKGLATNADKNIDGVIILTWAAVQDSKVVGYKIYRETSNDGKFEVPIGDVPEKHDESVPTFTDKNVIVGTNYETKYYYKIRAYKEDFEKTKENPDGLNFSELSESIQANGQNFSKPAAPLKNSFIIKASNIDSARVKLTWVVGSEIDLAGYYVYRREEDKPIPVDIDKYRISKKLITFKSGEKTTSWLDRDVTPGKRYWYTVAAVDKGELISQNPPSLRKDDILLERPNQDTPNDNETVSDTPTFKWQEVSGASGYIVALKKSRDFGGEIWRSAYIKTTSVTYDGAKLDSGETYYWYVYAYSNAPTNAQKEEGNSASAVRSFVIK